MTASPHADIEVGHQFHFGRTIRRLMRGQWSVHPRPLSDRKAENQARRLPHDGVQPGPNPADLVLSVPAPQKSVGPRSIELLLA